MRVWGAILCAVWCIVACGVIAVRAPGGRAFDTDIQSLLPQNALEPVIRAAIADAGGAASRRVTVLVTAEDPIAAQDAAADLERALTEAGVFAPDRTDGAEVGRWLFANRNALMCETDPARFDAAAVQRNAQVLLYAPIAPVSGQMLQRDPFLLTLQLAQCLAPAGGSTHGTLVSGALNASAFRIDVQDAVVAAYDAWRARHPEVQAARAGAVFFAEDGAHQARQEISLIAGASMVAIILLLLVCFRRPAAIFGTLAVTGVSLAGSLAAVLLVFPTVHVLVFVFGSALIGVTSDYALHFLATGPQTQWAPSAERVKRVARPLAVCALSTSIGFASLGFFGVSIFNQVAVFSVAGVMTAWWFTVTLLPLMDRRPRNPEKLARWWDKLEAPFRAFKWTGVHSVIVGALLLGALGAGVARYSTLDDVRQFQPRSPVLMAEGAQVQDALGFSASPAFVLSTGASADEARQREEALLAQGFANMGDVLAASRFDPSAARRAQNEQTLRDQLYTPLLGTRVAELGLTDVQPFAPPAEAPARPAMLAALEGEAGGTHYLVAPLGAATSRAAAISAEQGTLSLPEGVMFVDPAGRYSQAFAHFRGLAGWAVGVALLVCAVIVLLLYRTPRALMVLAAPVVGVIMGVAVPSALGQPISFFTVAALFVVIGTGIDHSVFLFEAAETDGQSKELVVFLAVVTTILSMGLMAFSSSYPVGSFGLAVAAGVTAAYVVSFAPVRVRGSKTT